jgi:hypothetical protein
LREIHHARRDDMWAGGQLDALEAGQTLGHDGNALAPGEDGGPVKAPELERHAVDDELWSSWLSSLGSALAPSWPRPRRSVMMRDHGVVTALRQERAVALEIVLVHAGWLTRSGDRARRGA